MYDLYRNHLVISNFPNPFITVHLSTRLFFYEKLEYLRVITVTQTINEWYYGAAENLDVGSANFKLIR